MKGRLTNRMYDGTAYVCSETGNEGVGHYTTQRRLPELISRLAEYEDAEAEGRLMVLPCKVGDVVYVDERTLPYAYLHLQDDCKDFAKCQIVSMVKTKSRTYMKLRALYPSRMHQHGYLPYAIGAIGKTVFLAREEAEEALRKGQSQ